MGRVLAHLGRSKAGARVRLPVRDRIQRLRHVHVPGALDEAGTARLVRARAERGSPVPDDVHASGGAGGDPRKDVRLQPGDAAADVDRLAPGGAAVRGGRQIDRRRPVDVAGRGVHGRLRPDDVEVAGAIDCERREILAVVDCAVAVRIER